MRINVVGTSGSGKSTLSKRISEQLSIPYIEMDRLYWKADWQEPSDEEFFAKLAQSLEPASWVLDGNYTRTTPIKWKCIDTVVWLDFSFPRTLIQAIKRAATRIITREELWPGTGNVETLSMLFSRDSIVLWTVTHFYKNRRKYESAMRAETHPHITFVRLRSPKQVNRYIATLKTPSVASE